MLENMRLAPATNESEDTLGTAKSLVEAKVALTAKCVQNNFTLEAFYM